MTIVHPPPDVERAESLELRPAMEAAPTGGRWTSHAGRAASSVAWAALGAAVLVGFWAFIASRAGDLPTPAESWTALSELLKQPFADRGPNDKGIGLQLVLSLKRVFLGFGLAALVGVPLGCLLGGSKRAWKAANPIVQVLRPVSPLAWFPIGLVAFQDPPRAAVFVIFITSLWPTVINTAVGAASVPIDHRNVAKVFRFGRFAYLRHVLVPHTLPSVVTGLRLSMGIAWMVIVAVEMLSGGTGIGFFVWDSYNTSNLPNVTAAIIAIGVVGFVLDTLFVRLHRKVGLEEVRP
ncbi:MAG: nitrate ABC transporter permease [Actinomycetota bacterium]|nr:nitrate ABC transporter permease [Actinomycetota bacterium]